MSTYTGRLARSESRLARFQLASSLTISEIFASSIATAEAFGTAVMGLYATPSAIASLEAFGLANMAQDVIVVAVAVPSGEAFGSPVMVLYLTPSGIIGAEAFGGHFVHFDIPLDPDLLVVLFPDLDMDVTAQVFSLPDVEEVDFTVNLAPDMELDVAPQEWDFSVTVN